MKINAVILISDDRIARNQMRTQISKFVSSFGLWIMTSIVWTYFSLYWSLLSVIVIYRWVEEFRIRGLGVEVKKRKKDNINIIKHRLTDWGQLTHTCVIGSNNGLSPGRCQAIIWTNAGILLIRTVGTNFSEILSGIHIFSLTKMHLNMAFVICRLSCIGLNVSRNKTRISHIHVASILPIKCTYLVLYFTLVMRLHEALTSLICSRDLT